MFLIFLILQVIVLPIPDYIIMLISLRILIVDNNKFLSYNFISKNYTLYYYDSNSKSQFSFIHIYLKKLN